jgi:2-polyprenyl-6-methoxyphenol hydroxylase-like FAD-dependent oxidoreductase
VTIRTISFVTSMANLTGGQDAMSGKHVSIIGASMMGLISARVLSDHFDHVTIFDRDTLPDACHQRKGVPQGGHGHGLLASGFHALQRLFPHLEQHLLEAGAVPGDIIGDVRWFQHGYYKAKFHSELGGILLSRPLLETTIREHVRQLSNVTIVSNTHVLGLVTDPDRRRVTGLRIQQAGRQMEIRQGELVVDASGRASRSPEWLAELGYSRPATEEVEIGLGYTTRTFRRRPGDLNGDIGVILAPKPPKQTRVGFMLAMEDRRWIVSIGGWLGDHAPTDPKGFLDFARSLSKPDIYDVIKDAEPLTDAITYAFPSNLRRRYERLDRFPGHYLVMSDALCSFNPIYGQGMSVAALEGLALAECIGRRPSLDELWRPFIQNASRIIDTPWTIAAGSDFAFRGVTGPKPAGTALVNWYLNRVHRAASHDRVVCRAFFDVANMLAPATTLFAPRLVGRVTKACLFAPAPPRTAPVGFRSEGSRISTRPQ